MPAVAMKALRALLVLTGIVLIAGYFTGGGLVIRSAALGIAAAVTVARVILVKEERLLWAICAVALCGWIGQLYYVAVPNAPVTFPALPDYMALIFYAGALVSIVLLLKGRLRDWRHSLLLDGVIGGLALSALVSLFVFQAALSGSGVETRIVNGQLAYAISDLFILGFLGAIALLGRWRLGLGGWGFVAAFSLLALADSVYVGAVANDRLLPSSLVTSLWAGGSLTIAATATTRRRVARAGNAAGFVPVALLGTSATSSLCLLVSYQIGLVEETPALAAVATAVLGVVVVRFCLALLENTRMLKESQRRAMRDGLTDISNQRAFEDQFPLAVAAAVRYQDPFALILLDVDDFKLINDRHGHPHGDAILKRVAAVLREARPGDRPYRIGGDEFALSLAHTDAEGARILARRLSRDLADAGIEVSIGVSALRPGLQADTLRAEADAALYEAKRQGGSQAAHFDDIRERVVVTTSEKKEAVRRLIDEGRLTTVFQPIWNFDAETLLGVEALTRPDPSYGLSGPAEAFDIAEQIGRVHQLDVLCVENALQFAPELEPGVLLFLNLSPLTLDLDAEADAWLAPAVERAGLSPQAVVVEVTERFGGRTASVIKRLKRLREQGFKIAIDDVGTGNSGLDMLSKIDAEFVKLDRSIVVAAATESSARAVLMAMATFARQTGAFVIAEGIEDEDTLQFLRGIDDRDLALTRSFKVGRASGLGDHHLSSHQSGPRFFIGSHSRAHSVLGAAMPTS